jgi:hypothetical protein
MIVSIKKLHALTQPPTNPFRNSLTAPHLTKSAFKNPQSQIRNPKSAISQSLPPAIQPLLLKMIVRIKQVHIKLPKTQPPTDHSILTPDY